ncbi:MAG: GntR family transcriptional regulator [Opitutaceae bacterium]|nr:GntR family transcriptional regulator [Opitutaceae bacterium]
MKPGKGNLTPVEAALRFGTRAESVARYLREAIARGELGPPFPPTRLWSHQLGVSRSTLDAALRQLVAERIVVVAPRGVRLRTAIRPAAKPVVAPRVRWLLVNDPHQAAANFQGLAGRLQERMRLKGIRVTWETGTIARLLEIARSPAPAGELCLLASVPPTIQQAFARSGRPALVLGEVAPGVALPYVNADFTGAVRHAAFQLLRDGCRRLVFIHIRMKAVGLERARESFAQAAAAWPAQPVPISMIESPLDRSSLQAAVRRLVAGLAPGTGCVVAAPLPVGMVAEAVAQRGWKVPQEVRLAGVFHVAEAAHVFQPWLHYPWPITAILGHLVTLAESFCATGRLPARGRTAPVALQRLT